MTKTVLIVDDSATMRQMVTDTLREGGYDVVAAINGVDALERLEGKKIHLVITDYNMPIMGGLALLKELRSKPEFKFTPILMLTTESAEARKNEGRAAGATGWIVKPFDPARLLQVIARVVA